MRCPNCPSPGSAHPTSHPKDDMINSEVPTRYDAAPRCLMASSSDKNASTQQNAPIQKTALLGDSLEPTPSELAHASFGVIQKSVLSWLSDVAFRARLGLGSAFRSGQQYNKQQLTGARGRRRCGRRPLTRISTMAHNRTVAERSVSTTQIVSHYKRSPVRSRLLTILGRRILCHRLPSK
jgi:hypothetical protein